MAVLYYPIWDTAVFGAAANTEFLLFQVAQQGDATHTESFTNSRGAGVFPASESYLIKKVSVVVDFNILQANAQTWYVGAFLEIRVSDVIRFKAPLQLLMDASAFGGASSTTAGANQNTVGLLGDGFELPPDRFINVPGGAPWKVRVFQVTAAAASSNIKVVLQGDLTIPGQS